MKMLFESELLLLQKQGCGMQIIFKEIYTQYQLLLVCTLFSLSKNN